MKFKKYDKIKYLRKIWPAHTVATPRMLAEHGFTNQDILGYCTSGWLERVTNGIYKLPGDTVDWTGAVYGLQKTKPTCFHVGGRTAIEMQGAAHYIRQGRIRCFLYTSHKVTPPKWLKGLDWGCDFVPLYSTILPPGLGLTTYEEGDFSLSISSRERSILEMIEGIDKWMTFQECNLVMENLLGLRSDLIQLLLEQCSSIKVKRIFLFLAKHNQHNWYERLDMEKIDLGLGTRQITKGGVYDKEFKITYPKEFIDELPEF